MSEQVIDIHDPHTAKEARKLCRDVELKPPSGFIETHSTHYGKWEGERLISLLSLKTINLNNTPGSVAVIIDIAASVDTNHSMSVAFESIKKSLRHRKNKCIIQAQAEAATCLARRRPHSIHGRRAYTGIEDPKGARLLVWQDDQD